MHEASIKYGPSTSSIERWLYHYRRDGIQALQIKKRGRPKGMGRPKKNSSSLTEFEKLQKENQELKTEIALLKKNESLSRENESPSTQDRAMVIEGLRQEGHPLQFMLERMKMARSTYYHCAHANYDDGHDELRKKSERFLKIAKRYMAIGAYG